MEKMLEILRQKGFKVYTRPFELNIVGIRSESADKDELHVFYRLPSGKWNYHVFAARTDTATFSHNNSIPLLKEGQYLDAYQFLADSRSLKQVKPVTIIRDYLRGAIFDLFNGEEENGMFSININKE